MSYMKNVLMDLEDDYDEFEVWEAMTEDEVKDELPQRTV